MKPTDKAEFVKLLTVCYSTALRALPAPEAIDLWQAMLAPYPLEQVRAALNAHMRSSRQAPVPADVLSRLEPGGDLRPQADEAWAIALKALDERETVVWSDETAQAWEISRALAASDETGARFAFRAAYMRLVDEARARNVPVHWSASPGHDPQRRIEVVEAAVRAGYLAFDDARAAVPTLPAPEATRDAPGPAQTGSRERLRELVGGILVAQQRRLVGQRDASARATDVTADRKHEIARQVDAYAAAHGIRQREPGDDDETPA